MNEQDLDKLEADIREESALIKKLIDEIAKYQHFLTPQSNENIPF